MPKKEEWTPPKKVLSFQLFENHIVNSLTPDPAEWDMVQWAVVFWLFFWLWVRSKGLPLPKILLVSVYWWKNCWLQMYFLPFPTFNEDWVVLAVKYPLFVDIYGKAVIWELTGKVWPKKVLFWGFPWQCILNLRLCLFQSDFFWAVFPLLHTEWYMKCTACSRMEAWIVSHEIHRADFSRCCCSSPLKMSPVKTGWKLGLFILEKVPGRS